METTSMISPILHKTAVVLFWVGGILAVLVEAFAVGYLGVQFFDREFLLENVVVFILISIICVPLFAFNRNEFKKNNFKGSIFLSLCLIISPLLTIFITPSSYFLVKDPCRGFTIPLGSEQSVYVSKGSDPVEVPGPVGYHAVCIGIAYSRHVDLPF